MNQASREMPADPHKRYNLIRQMLGMPPKTEEQRKVELFREYLGDCGDSSRVDPNLSYEELQHLFKGMKPAMPYEVTFHLTPLLEQECKNYIIEHNDVNSVEDMMMEWIRIGLSKLMFSGEAF